MSLKSHLLSNPCGSRPISEYLRDIRTTADELAIAGHPMTDDDLVLLTLNGLRDEYSNIRSAIKVREAPMTFAALHEQLVDHERGLKDKVPEPNVVTANFTQKGNYSRGMRSNYSFNPRTNSSWNQSPHGRSYGPQYGRNNQPHFNKQQPWQNQPHAKNNHPYCQYCQRPGLATKECRQLARFLKDNDIRTPTPAVDNTMLQSNQKQQWLFDTWASHHITNDPTTHFLIMKVQKKS